MSPYAGLKPGATIWIVPTFPGIKIPGYNMDRAYGPRVETLRYKMDRAYGPRVETLRYKMDRAYGTTTNN